MTFPTSYKWLRLFRLAWCVLDIPSLCQILPFQSFADQHILVELYELFVVVLYFIFVQASIATIFFVDAPPRPPSFVAQQRIHVSANEVWFLGVNNFEKIFSCSFQTDCLVLLFVKSKLFSVVCFRINIQIGTHCYRGWSCTFNSETGSTGQSQLNSDTILVEFIDTNVFRLFK